MVPGIHLHGTHSKRLRVWTTFKHFVADLQKNWTCKWLWTIIIIIVIIKTANRHTFIPNFVFMMMLWLPLLLNDVMDCSVLAHSFASECFQLENLLARSGLQVVSVVVSGALIGIRRADGVGPTLKYVRSGRLLMERLLGIRVSTVGFWRQPMVPYISSSVNLEERHRSRLKYNWFSRHFDCNFKVCSIWDSVLWLPLESDHSLFRWSIRFLFPG